MRKLRVGCYLVSISIIACGKMFSQGAPSIKGFLEDSITRSKVIFATVTVYNASDTTIVAYRLSDPEGQFRVPNLPLNTPLRAVISHSGYRVHRLEFQLTNDKPIIDFGAILLNVDFTPLEDVLVFAERPPVIVRNDTIEFNAASFKTLPNALVEDLLKKLPGINVERDGSIKVNGKTVNRILVDGKEFFGSDVRIATRNLPANIIDKVQVTDDQEELEENLMADRTTVGKVINLKLKKGIKKGWFGKTYAGAGTDQRYELGGIANLFRDTFQVSLIGFSNNINKPAFGLDDIRDIGGFNRSGYSSSMVSTNGGIALDGISFGATSQGIQTSTGGGVNVNTELSRNKSFNFKYFYGNITSKYDRASNVDQFFNDTTIRTTSIFNQFSKDNSHQIGGSLRWKVGASSNLTIRPNLTFVKRIANTDIENSAIRSFKGLLSESKDLNHYRERYNTFATDVIYRHNFQNRGRMISVAGTFYSHSDESELLIDNAIAFDSGNLTESLNQLRNRSMPSLQIGISATYVMSLSKTVMLQFSNSETIIEYKDNLTTYDRDQNTGNYTVFNPTNSNRIKRFTYSNTSTFGSTWAVKKMRFSPRINFQILAIDNDFQKPIIGNQFYRYFQPGLSLTWNGVFLNYSSTVTDAKVSDLQVVGDYTNLLFVRFGNANLQPTVTQSAYLTFDKYDAKNLLTYRCLFSSIYAHNGIIYRRTIDSAAIQRSSAINVNGVYSYRSNLSLTKQVKAINKWDISVSAALYSDLLRSKMIINDEESSVINFNVTPTISYSLNIADKFELNQGYSYKVNNGKYSTKVFKNSRVSAFNVTSEIILRSIKNVVIESSIDYLHNIGKNRDFQANVIVWNAGINYLLLKDKKGDLKISAYDLLNQNKIINRTINENSISEEAVTTLKRFFIVSFIYNIRNVKPKKVGGKDKLLLF